MDDAGAIEHVSCCDDYQRLCFCETDHKPVSLARHLYQRTLNDAVNCIGVWIRATTGVFKDEGSTATRKRDRRIDGFGAGRL